MMWGEENAGRGGAEGGRRGAEGEVGLAFYARDPALIFRVQFGLFSICFPLRVSPPHSIPPRPDFSSATCIHGDLDAQVDEEGIAAGDWGVCGACVGGAGAVAA